MKNFKQFKEDLESMAAGGQQERGPVTNTSSDNLQAQALRKRREGASSKAQEIAKRQLQQKQINQQKREGGVKRG